jgi:hypothetical protein
MKQSATLFAALSAIAMIAAVVTGLIVIGSPSEFRMRRFDERRANDLASISGAVRTYRLTHENLPQKLGDLEAAITYSLKDPVERPYEYAVKDEFSYELCAEFDTTTETLSATRFSSVFEKHGSGRQCFTQEARPPARR